MESFLSDLNNKLKESEKFGLLNSSSSISCNNQSLHPEWFYKKNQDSTLLHNHQFYSRFQPQSLVSASDSRSELSSSRFARNNSFLNKSRVPSLFRRQEGNITQHQSLLNEDPLVNQHRARRINETQCASVSSQLTKPSEVSDRLRHNESVLTNKFPNAQCSIIGSTVVNHDIGKNNLGRRVNDSQYSTCSQQLPESVVTSDQSRYNFNNKTTDNDVKSQCVVDDHHFRRPYDVRGQSGVRHVFMEDQMPYGPNAVYRPDNMSVASSLFLAPSYSLQQVKDELSMVTSVIDLVNSEMGIPVEEVKINIKTFVMKIKRKVQKLICKSFSSNMSTTSANILSEEKAQFIHEWLNSSMGSEPSRPLPPPSTCSSMFTSVSIQQPHATGPGPSRPLLPHSAGSSTFMSVNMQQPLATEPVESVAPTSTTNPSAGNDDAKKKGSSPNLSVMHVTLRTRKQNTSKQPNKELKDPLAVCDKYEASKLKRSLSASPLRCKQNKVKKTLAEPHAKVGSSDQSTINNKTTKNNKSTSLDKENIEHETNKNRIPSKKNIKEKVLANKSKAVDKLSPKETAEEPATQRSRSRKDCVSKTVQQEEQLKSVAAESQRVNASYISLRGRVVLPKLKYWEVNRQPETTTKGLENDDIQPKRKINPNTSFLNVTLRERKPKTFNEEFKKPTAAQNNKQNSKQKRNPPASPPKIQQYHLVKTTKTLNDPDVSVASSKQVSGSSKTTKKNNKPAQKKKQSIENESKKKELVSKKKNNKDNQPVKCADVRKESEKPANSRGRKRKSNHDSPDLAKKKKQLNNNPDTNDAGYPFKESFQLFETKGPSTNYCFEVPSPGEALNSIRKKAVPTSGRETPPTRYVHSFMDCTGNTKSPSVISGDEHSVAAKSHSADRIVQKMMKAKGSNKQRKRKITKKKTKTDTAIEDLLSQVIHAKVGKTPKKVEQAFRTKLPTKNYDGSSDSWADKSDSDNYEDLN